MFNNIVNNTNFWYAGKTLTLSQPFTSQHLILTQVLLKDSSVVSGCFIAVYLRLRFVRLETTNTICGWRS